VLVSPHEAAFIDNGDGTWSLNSEERLMPFVRLARQAPQPPP
jgi:hypothetical protein